MSKILAFLCVLAVSLALTDCSPDRMPLTDADNGRTITVGIGDAIEVKLGTVGPGEYGTPDVSSPSIQFVSVEVVGPYTPGGPTQLFHFLAAERGKASITISQVGGFSSRSFGITANVAP